MQRSYCTLKQLYIDISKNWIDNTMISSELSSVFQKLGHSIENIAELKGGSNNKVFSVYSKQQEFIVKFPMQRIAAGECFQKNKDKLFNGDLSLDREVYILDLIRSLDVPAPRYFGIFHTQFGDCIVLEKIKGTDFAAYMKQNNYHLENFIDIIKSLAQNFRKLHSIRFPSFGNLMNRGTISPPGFINFIDRYQEVNDMILNLCKQKKCFNQSEFIKLSDFIQNKFTVLRAALDIQCRPATLVITDMHGGNFHVFHNSVSGFFDVESSQSAPLEFELYCMRLFIFNFFGAKEFALAESAFWKAYCGCSTPDIKSSEIIDFFSFLRIVELCQSYWGYTDGIRDNWGKNMKASILEYIDSEIIDYIKIGDVWRQRDAQPRQAI